MPKGYMIFVEGKEPPTMVHRTHQSAWHEMHRLAAENPDHSVLLLNVSRRFMYKNGEQRAESIGSHLPKDDRIIVPLEELIKRKEI